MKNSHFWMAVGIFLVALVPRLLFAFAPHPPLFSDMEDYDRAAVSFLMGHHLAMSPDYLAYRPPGYPLFLAAIYWTVGRNLTLVRVVQAVLSAGSCVLLYVLAAILLRNEKRSLLRSGVPFLSGLLFALYESHIFLSGVFLTETLFTFLLLLFFLFLCGFSDRPVFRLSSAFLLGILALIRPTAVLYLPVIFYVEVQRLGDGEKWERRGWLARRWILHLLLFLIPMIPWTVRNALVLHSFVPISTNGGVNFYIGHHPGYSYWSTGAKEVIRAQTDLNEVEESRLFFRLGLDYILEHPGQTLVDTWRKIVYLLKPGIPVWPMGDQGYDLRFALFPLLRTIRVDWNWLFLILSIFGGVLIWREIPMSRAMHLVVFFHIVAVLIYFARARFRVPLEPVFLLWGVYALLRSMVEVGDRFRRGD
ncbi:MAG TPA: hypothetical protein PLZ55_03700 [bacterium]|nr:hypothetical protein [bacterium]